MSGISAGPRYLGRGFAFLRHRPRLYLLGIVPALLVFVVLAAAWVMLALNVGSLVGWLTPFADDWGDLTRGVLRVLLAAAVLVAALLLASSMFVGLTLTVGDPFYERIWRATEESLGGVVPDHEPGLGQAARDGLVLTAVGMACSAAVVVAGFVPVVGPVGGVLLGITLSGRLLARELLSRPLVARGLDAQAQDAAIAPHRSTVLGFGVATQLWFLVPFGAVLVMPAAVAGATLLARERLLAQD
ncbi:MAG: EI24 domain-containing protein [Nocardioides sp.]